jgi:ribosomal protein S18 acetylase RimI-like enzyme
MSIIIRPCAPGDETRLSAVAQATFLESYAGVIDGGDILLQGVRVHAAEQYGRLLRDAGVDLFLAEMAPGGAPVGFAMLSPPDLPVAVGPGDLELKRIYVLHRFHGEGLGPRLMAAVLERAGARLERAGARGAKRLLLGAYGENHRAIAFYRRHGFEQVGTRLFRVGENDYDDVVLAKVM